MLNGIKMGNFIAIKSDVKTQYPTYRREDIIAGQLNAMRCNPYAAPTALYDCTADDEVAAKGREH